MSTAGSIGSASVVQRMRLPVPSAVTSKLARCVRTGAPESTL